MLSTFTQYQLYSRDQAQTLQTIASSPVNKMNQQYFDSNIGKVTSVDGFINNYRLFSYAMESYGLSDMTYAKAFMKKVLTSDLSNPNSYANQLSDPRFKTFAEAFSFSTTGAVGSTAAVQSSDQESDTLGLYDQRGATNATQVAASTTSYTSAIAGVKTVDDLLNNSQLLSYVETAYGFSPETADASQSDVTANIRAALTSDPNDPTSFAASSSDPRYLALAKAFSFDAAGNATGAAGAQTANQLATTTAAFAANSNNLAAASDQAATATFQAEIGSVKSVDDLLSNKSLTSYVMTAYGLDPSSVSTNDLRVILESNTSYAGSYANVAGDSRYVDLAKAFNFGPDGTVAAGSSAQTSAQTASLVAAFQSQSASSVDSAGEATTAFQADIGGVTSVSGLLGNSAVRDYVLTAFGFDPSSQSDATLTKVLSSRTYAASLNDPRYVALNAAFNFNTSGTLASGTTAQTSAQTADVVSRFTASASDAASNASYYKTAMANVTSVDDLLNDPKLYDYILASYGIPQDSATMTADQTKAAVRDAMTGDPSTPASVASDTRFTSMAKDFNFDTDGSLPAGASAQSASGQASTLGKYSASLNVTAAAADAALSTYATTELAEVSSVSDILNDPKLYAYVLRANGLDPNTESQATIKSVLLSDASGANTYANSQSDERYQALGSEFNFAADGSIAAPPLAQSTRDVTITLQNYIAQAGSGTAAAAAAKTEATYYQTNIDKVTNVDDLLANTRLVGFMEQAAGITAGSISTATLRQALTSDPTDPKSFVNTQTNAALRSMALTLNFNASGEIVREPASQIQSKAAAYNTTQMYLEQTLEDQAGQQNTGVQLALYFARKASTISSAYSILGDKALLKVVQTALNLPASSSNADIDIQARTISSQIKISDFKDPAKVQQFLSRFSVLYDLQNGNDDDNGVLSLFAGDSGDTGVLSLFE